MSLNIESLIKTMELKWLYFKWLCIVPAIIAFIMVSLGSLYRAFTIGSCNRKVYRKKFSKQSSEAIIKIFRIMHDQGKISRKEFESIKRDYSKK